VTVAITLQYPKITRKNKHDATISKNHKKKQARRYNIQKSPEKTSTTLQYPKVTRKNKHNQGAIHNQHNEDRRYNIPLNLLLVATGCKVHCGRLGALWVRGCFVKKRVAHVLQRHACR
jgi:hypothetical protein